jgi:hypothetical protein
VTTIAALHLQSTYCTTTLRRVLILIPVMYIFLHIVVKQITGVATKPGQSAQPHIPCLNDALTYYLKSLHQLHTFRTVWLTSSLTTRSFPPPFFSLSFPHYSSLYQPSYHSVITSWATYRYLSHTHTGQTANYSTAYYITPQSTPHITQHLTPHITRTQHITYHTSCHVTF